MRSLGACKVAEGPGAEEFVVEEPGTGEPGAEGFVAVVPGTEELVAEGRELLTMLLGQS